MQSSNELGFHDIQSLSDVVFRTRMRMRSPRPPGFGSDKVARVDGQGSTCFR